MKILFFEADVDATGGIERMISTLSNEWSKDKKYHITILSEFKSKEKPFFFFPPAVKIDYLSDERFTDNFKSFEHIHKRIKILKLLKTYLGINKFDFLIANSFPSIALLILAGIKSEKIIGVEHVAHSYYNPIIRLFKRILYKKIGTLIVLTPNEKKYYSKFVKKVILIPNPGPEVIDVKEYDSLFPKREKVLLASGRLVRQKGFEQLVLTYARIASKYPEWMLHIYGEGYLEGKLLNLIKDLNLESRVCLMGNSSRLMDVFKSGSVFILSSIKEGFALVLLESMANGLPVIAYDCPEGPSYILEGGKYGYLVKNQDQQALANAIEELIQNENIRFNDGKRALERAKDFDVAVIVRKWKRLIESIT